MNIIYLVFLGDKCDNTKKIKKKKFEIHLEKLTGTEGMDMKIDLLLGDDESDNSISGKTLNIAYNTAIAGESGGSSVFPAR